TRSKLSHRNGTLSGPGLNPLMPIQSTYADPGQNRSTRFFGTNGTDRWFTLHTHVAFVAPARTKRSCMCRHAATYSAAVFPRENADHGYQLPSISCIGRMNSGPPYRRTWRA